MHWMNISASMKKTVLINWISSTCSEKKSWRQYRRAYPRQPDWLSLQLISRGIPLHRQPPFHAIVRRFAITRRQWRDVNLRMPSVPSRQQLHKRQTYTFVPADFWRWPFQLLSAAIIWEVLLGGRFNAMMPRNLSAGCHRLCILPRRMRRLQNTGRCWRKFLFIHMKNFWILRTWFFW